MGKSRVTVQMGANKKMRVGGADNKVKTKNRGMRGRVLLSFDVEEFDLPKEHGVDITLERGIEVSAEGLGRILDLLDKAGVRATFFCTGNFAKARPEMLQRMLEAGHEVACHGVDHFKPQAGDIANSKQIVEKVVENLVDKNGKKPWRGYKVRGYRQPRMGAIDYVELERCGYSYDTSVNPAFIPGRYNHLSEPREPFRRGQITEVPVSVAGVMRVPLFWLALHLFPVGIYLSLVRMSLGATGYYTTYFHPWEFSEALRGQAGVPGYIKYNSGLALVRRLEKVIDALRAQGCVFVTYGEFLALGACKC